MKVLHSIYQKIWKIQQWPQDWKSSVFIPVSKKGNAKESSNYCTMVLISHAREVMQKFSELGFNRMRTENFQMFKLDLEKGEESDVKLPASAGSSKKKENSRKNIYFSFIDYPFKAFDCVDHKKTVKNSSRDRNTRPPYLLLRNLYAGQEATVRTRHGTMD